MKTTLKTTLALAIEKITHLPRLSPAILLYALGLGIFAFATSRGVTAATFTVDVAPGGALLFSPFSVSIQPGDTVMWVWKGSGHSATSGTPTAQTALFDSGVHNTGFTFSFTFTDPGTVKYFCLPHGACCGMIGNVIVAGATPTPTPTPFPGTILANISTRGTVQPDPNALIGGFIVSGTQAKKVIVRAIGPSLGNGNPPVQGALADPTLELHDGTGALLAMNDNWMDAPNKQEIIDSTIPPTDDLESAILMTLPANNSAYTAIVRGVNNTSGIGLVEAYDLDNTVDSRLANISTRGLVQPDPNALIGGFIVTGTGMQTVVVRAIGPSLPVPGALADPTLELHDGNGALLAMNDNWKDNSITDQATLTGNNLAPTNDAESAIVATLAAGNTTAIVRGVNGTTGVGLVEVYALSP